jgi:hypothetical protein
MFKTTLLWTLAAIAGVVLVAGVTYAASGLSTQTIGLSSEPLSAGEDLSPKATPTATPHAAATPQKRKKARRPRATATATATAPPPVVTAAPTTSGGAIEPGDDSGGHGRNSGSGGSGGGSGGHGSDD